LSTDASSCLTEALAKGDAMELF